MNNWDLPDDLLLDDQDASSPPVASLSQLASCPRPATLWHVSTRPIYSCPACLLLSAGYPTTSLLLSVGGPTQIQTSFQLVCLLLLSCNCFKSDLLDGRTCLTVSIVTYMYRYEQKMVIIISKKFLEYLSFINYVSKCIELIKYITTVITLLKAPKINLFI